MDLTLPEVEFVAEEDQYEDIDEDTKHEIQKEIFCHSPLIKKHFYTLFYSEWILLRFYD